MKIFQINTVCHLGSTGRISTDLYKELEDQGHECIIAFGRGNAPKEIRAVKIGSNLSVYIHCILSRITDKHGFYSLVATKNLIAKIKEYNPDIIHLHNIHGYYINIDILFGYLKDANKPVIWTLHDCWAFTGHCVHFDYIKCNRWEVGCYNCSQKMTYPKSLIFDNSSMNYQKKKELFTSVKNMTIVTPSKWLAEIVKKSFLNKYPVQVIYNGIDLEVFKPTESDFRINYGLLGKKIILGVANTWTSRKGLDKFVELSRYLDSRYRIVIVGVTRKQKKNLPKNILGLSRTNDINKLVKIYSAADIFINPSVEETMGLTTVEALACGIPVIVFNTTASPEIVNQDCGIIVDRYDVQSLVGAIENIKTEHSTSVIQAMNFDKKKQYMKYIEIYKKYK